MITKQALENAKFCLTAYNRAPEVNAFGRPRLGLWPLQAEVAKRNYRDALLAFCSTVNSSVGKNYPFYFQRFNTYTDSNNVAFAQTPPPSSQNPQLDWAANNPLATTAQTQRQR